MKDWLKRKVQLGHKRTLLYELEEEDIASFNNYFRMDPDTFNEILERITPRIKKLTTNYKTPFLHLSDWLLHWGSIICIIRPWTIRKMALLTAFSNFNERKRHRSWPKKHKRVIYIFIWVVYVAVRSVRMVGKQGPMNMNCTADSACPAYESSQYIRYWYICFGLQFGWCIDVICTVWMSCINYGPCVDVY